MATTVGNIRLNLGINSSGFKKQLNGITKVAKTSTNSMSSMFGNLGKTIAAAFAVKAVANFAKECLSLGSDLAEVQNVVDVTFGGMSTKVNDFAKNAMESYGLSEKVAKQYMGTFGAMSKAFGNTTEAAYDQAAALTGLAGDVASFYNLTTDEAYTKLKSVFTGETESLKDLGVVMTQTALDEYALQKGMGKTTSQMSEQEKVALRLAFVTDRLSTASGDFSRTAGGWANQTRVLALRFDALKASIGQGLINVLLPIVRVLNEIISRLQVAADAFSNFTAAIFGKADVSSAVTESASATGILSENLSDGATSAAAIKKSLAGFDQLNLLSNNSGGSSNTGTSGGSTGTAGAATPQTKPMDVSFVSPVIDAFRGFAQDIAPFIATLKDIFSWLYNEVLVPLSDWAANSLLPATLNALGGAFNFINSVLDALQPMAKWLWDEFLEPIASWTGGVIVDVLNGIGDGLRGISDWITENQTAVQVCTGTIAAFVGAWKVTELLGWLGMAGGVIKLLKLWSTELWANLAAKVANKAEDIAILALYAKDYVVALGGIIAKVVKSTGVWIANTAAKVASTAAEWAHIAATTAYNAITAVATTVTTAFGAALTFLTSPIGLVVVAIAALTAGFVLLWNNCEGFRNFFINMWEKIKSVVGAVVNWIKENWQTMLLFLVNPLAGTFKYCYEHFEGFRNFVDKIVTSVKNFFTGLWSGIKSGASSAVSSIKSTFSNIGSWFGDKANAVKDKFSSMWSKLKSGASSAWTGIKDTFSKVPTWFKDKFTDAWTKVKNVFSSGGKIFDGIKDGISDAFKKIVNKLIDGINTIVSKPFNKINELLGKIRNIKILGSKPFSWLGSVSVPQIPKLATGGYVAANTPQLAIIGDNKREGEIVAPESKIAEAVAVGVATAMRQIAELLNARNNNFQSPIVIKIGERDVWQGFVDYHNSTVKRTGNSPLLI